MFLDVVLCCKISGELDLVSIGIDDSTRLNFFLFVPSEIKKNPFVFCEFKINLTQLLYKSHQWKTQKKNDTIYDIRYALGDVEFLY